MLILLRKQMNTFLINMPLKDIAYLCNDPVTSMVSKRWTAQQSHPSSLLKDRLVTLVNMQWASTILFCDFSKHFYVVLNCKLEHVLDFCDIFVVWAILIMKFFLKFAWDKKASNHNSYTFIFFWRGPQTEGKSVDPCLVFES